MTRLAALLPEAEVLLHVLKPATASIIAQAPRLKLIQKIGVGVNTIDLAAARARGIAVANMPGTNTPAVAETALLLMLAALRNLAGLDRACRAGTGWEAGPALQEQAGELRGRVVGLVGAGMVPQALVPMLHGLGARPVYWSRTEHPELGIPRRELDELLATADIVSLHLPLVPETERLIDGAALARMKPGAILVNTARGGLVDEAALVAALTSGHLRAAGLDVFAEEPVPPDNPLLALDNVALMPHVAWLTPETLDRSLDVAVENMRRLRAGAELRAPGGVRRITLALLLWPCRAGAAAEQAGKAALAVDVDRHGRGHAGAQRRLALVRQQPHPHRQALHDLDPVARGVLRRQDRELGAGRRADALDLGAPGDVRVDVEHDRGFLPRLYMRQVGLLHVGLDPGPRLRHQHEQRRRRLDLLARLQFHVDGGAADRRLDRGALQVELGAVALGLLFAHQRMFVGRHLRVAAERGQHARQPAS